MSVYYSSAITDTIIHILQEIREKKKQKLPEAWTTGTELHGSCMEWLQISKKFWFVIAAMASVSMLFKAGWVHTAPSALSELLTSLDLYLPKAVNHPWSLFDR